MTLGERIKAVREKAGMTQVELGKKVGVSGVAIMRYEKGTRQLRIGQLQSIADALEVSIDYLCGLPISTLSENVFHQKVEPRALPADDLVEAPATETSGASSALGRRQAEISSANQLLKALVDQYEGNLEDLLDGISRLSVEEREALTDASATILIALRTGEATVGKPVATRTGGPQNAPTPQEGKDTTPATDTTETPPDDK